MNQPTPKVTREDVGRVVRRDFAAERYDSVMAILDEYGRERWQREPHRVQLAVLKLAAGNLEELRRAIETAKCDFRDVLAYAKYPAYMKKTFRIAQLPPEEQRKIIDEDWRQYESWLKGTV